MNRTCFKCNEYTNDTWTIELKDDKKRVEITGCKLHIDELYEEVQNVKDLKSKTVSKVVKELKLDVSL